MRTPLILLSLVMLVAPVAHAADAKLCYERDPCNLPCTFTHVDWNTGVLVRLPKQNDAGEWTGGGGFYEEPHVGQSQGSSTANKTEWYTDDPEYRALGILQVRWISKGKVDEDKGGVKNGTKAAANRFFPGNPHCALFQVHNPKTRRFGNLPNMPGEVRHPDSKPEIGDRCSPHPAL